MRINGLGQFEYCRWALRETTGALPSIRTSEPITFFKQNMAEVRVAMANGESPKGCATCDLMQQHGKVSGRQRQLLKIGVREDYYDQSFASSPWYSEILKTDEQNGNIDLYPQDWQIDLGNLCNSACIFCHPYSSSRLGTEWKKLNIVTEINNKQWTNDDVAVKRMLDTLTASKRIAYIHFIGGELVINPAFKRILNSLIEAGLNTQISIGFTTGLTDWDDELVDALVQFKEVNMGLSIECLDSLNDYIRYPSNIDTATQLMDKWLAVAKENNWLSQLRITPTILSMGKLIPLFDFALEHSVATESCNFINDPIFMSPAVLPVSYRTSIIADLEDWVATNDQHKLSKIINTRDPNIAHQQVVEDVKSYINFLKDQPDESSKLPALVSRLKLLESNRNNSILDHLPEYAQLFKDAGY
jgi:hypothetical protein